MRLVLPFPPSVNTYYRSISRGGHATAIISASGRAFRGVVKSAVGFVHPDRRLTGRLSVTVELFPPDRRRRDIDNYIKALLDAITHAGVWEDDSQIDCISVFRCSRVAGGKTIVEIEEIGK